MVLHVGWTACRVFPCHFAVSISRLIFVQVSPPSLDLSVVNSSLKAAGKASIQTCSANLFKV